MEEGVEIDYRTFHRLFRRVRTKFNATAAASGKSAERWAKGEDGETKTEASDGYVPLHAVLAHFLSEWRAQTPYAADEDFVFPALRAKGRVPSRHLSSLLITSDRQERRPGYA